MLNLKMWDKGTSWLANCGSLSDIVKGQSQSSLRKKERKIALIFHILSSTCTWVNQDK